MNGEPLMFPTTMNDHPLGLGEKMSITFLHTTKSEKEKGNHIWFGRTRTKREEGVQ